MILVITGNVDVEETFSVVESNQFKKKFHKFKSIKIKSYNESNSVYKKQEKINMNIEIPKVGIGYKIDVSNIKENINDIKVLLSTMLEIKLGSTSLLKEKLVKENLITNNIDFSLVNTDKHILVIIMVDAKEQDIVFGMIDDELKSIKITEEELNRRRKVLKSNCIYRSDNIYSLNSKIVNNLFNYDKVILDEYEMIDKINMKNIKRLLSKISFDNKTVYYINKS